MTDVGVQGFHPREREKHCAQRKKGFARLSGRITQCVQRIERQQYLRIADNLPEPEPTENEEPGRA